MEHDVGKRAKCSRCGRKKKIEMQTTIHKRDSEWIERLCKDCTDKEDEKWIKKNMV